MPTAEPVYRLYRYPPRLVHLSPTTHRTEYALSRKPTYVCLTGKEVVFKGRQIRPLLPNHRPGDKVRRKDYKNIWPEPKCTLRVRVDIEDARRADGLVATAVRSMDTTRPIVSEQVLAPTLIHGIRGQPGPC